MSDEFDVNAYVRRHQAEMAARFRQPDASSFESQYGEPLPPQLARLYSLREALMRTPVGVSTTEGTLFIQSFTPLVSATVMQGARYEWKFFEFAVGPDNESLLYSIEQPLIVYVDHSGDGSDVEMTTVTFAHFVDELEGAIANSWGE